MALYRILDGVLQPVERTSFVSQGILERTDLQAMLRDKIDVIVPDAMVVCEEFRNWEDAKRRIDLLCLDRDANLVVVEIKRDSDGGHMELQAIRYAAMVSSMTFEQLVDAHEQYLIDRGEDHEDAADLILSFLRWDEPDETEFPKDVRIVLVSADFSTEITTAVLWLNQRDLDIRCVRLSPHALDGQVVLSIDQCLPLPSAEAYQVRLRHKAISQRDQRRAAGNWTGCWFMNTGVTKDSKHRSWEDCRKYGFLLAGGGEKWIRAARRLRADQIVFAYVEGSGYVGAGRVMAEAVPQREFVVARENKRLMDLPLTTPPNPTRVNDDQQCDWCVAVEWIKTVDRDQGVLRNRSYRGTVCRIRQAAVAEELAKEFGIELPQSADS